MFSYWQATAVPWPVQVIDSPGSSAAFGQVTWTPRSSLTSILVSRTLLVFVATYSHRTGEPTARVGPGASSASSPLVSFLSPISPGGVIGGLGGSLRQYAWRAAPSRREES